MSVLHSHFNRYSLPLPPFLTLLFLLSHTFSPSPFSISPLSLSVLQHVTPLPLQRFSLLLTLASAHLTQMTALQGEAYSQTYRYFCKTL